MVVKPKILSLKYKKSFWKYKKLECDRNLIQEK